MLATATAPALDRCPLCHAPGPREICSRCESLPERLRAAALYRERVRVETLERLAALPRPSLDEGSAAVRDRIIETLEGCMHQVEFRLLAEHLVTPDLEAGLDDADRRLLRQYLTDREWTLRDTLDDAGPREEAPPRMPLTMWLDRWHRSHA